MNSKKLFCCLILLMAFSGCTKAPGKTAAKLKLNLAGIVDFTNGIGNGGAILFGKSSTGEQFGKIITGAEENLDLANGSWSFYAVMWNKNGGTDNFSDLAYCGKNSQQLTGSAISISMNLNNDNCADPVFSAGDTGYDAFVSPSFKKHFPKVYLEECDDLNNSTSYSCLKNNQGSALSYRLVFNSYKRNGNGNAVLAGDAIHSACTPVAGGTNLHGAGLQANFPSSSVGMPFVVSVEMFMSTINCDVNDPKGVYKHTFHQGYGASSPNSKVASNSGVTCTPVITSEIQCMDNFGTWAGSCTGISTIVTNFVPTPECSSAPGAPSTTTPRYVKQMFSIPKGYLCRNMNDTSLTATSVFPGGDGSELRPFKICNEWQYNYIGEDNSSNLSSYSYMLVNDLDMNKTDVMNVYPKPSCSTAPVKKIGGHHNMNPFDKITSGDCTTYSSVGSGYTGTFYGNNKTIANGRIVSEDAVELGLVRHLGVSGRIRDVKLKNLEVRGSRYVAGIAGQHTSNLPLAIHNINIDKLDIEGKSSAGVGDYIGGVAGLTVNGSSTSRILVTNAKVRGRSEVGGVIGASAGSLHQAGFRGIVRNDYSPAGATGGLVGYNLATGYITESYTEGAINSFAADTGGISGVNNGVVDNIYSLMVVGVSYNGAAAEASVGGIQGSGTGGFSNAYFDGLLSYNGANAALSKHPISSDPVLGGDNNNSNYFFTNVSNVQTMMTVTYTNLRTKTTYSLHATVAPKWKFNDTNTVIDELTPRLAWQDEQCFTNNNTDLVSTQISAGRGTSAANPVTICSASQLMSMTSASSKYYKLLTDLNLSATAKANFIPNFYGHLDGGDKGLYGLLVVIPATDSSEALGLFKINHGTIKNLFLIGNYLENNDTNDYESGLLTGRNNGTISNVKIRGSFLKGQFNLGSITGTNNVSGIIENIDIDSTNVAGYVRVGGVAGQNYPGGKIKLVKNNSFVSVYANAQDGNYEDFGGVVGKNNGLVEQVRSDGQMVFGAASGASYSNIGGIVGNNTSTGIVKNVLTTDRFVMSVYDTKRIGGLIGENSGALENSIGLGRVLFKTASYTEATPAQSFHSLVGYKAGGSTHTNTFYLRMNAGSVLGADQNMTSCSYFAGTLSYRFIPTSLPFFTTATPADLLFFPDGNYGDYVNKMKPINVPSNYVVDFDGATACPDANARYTPIKSYTFSDFVGEKTAPEFSLPVTFNMTDWDMGYLSQTTPGSNVREAEIMTYMMASMNGQDTPPGTPVWILEEGEKNPDLLQLPH